jgi:RND family efflux transporter MFP subunit
MSQEFGAAQQKPPRRRSATRYLALGAFVLIVAFAFASSARRSRTPRAPAAGVTSVPPAPSSSESDAVVPVVAAIVQPGTVTETARLTGSLKTDENVVLSTKLAGKVAMLRVREGDHVRAGQLVVQMDDSENRAQRARALGAVHAAEAKLAQTRAGTVVKDTGAEEDYAKARAATAAAREKLTELQHSAQIQDTMSETRVRTAQAGLQSAKEHLKEMQQGSRRQELLMADQAVRRAQVDLENARRANVRRQQLFQEGAISQQDADDAQRAYEVAQLQLQDAQQQRSLTQEGPRTEEIRMAEQQVTQAEQTLQEAEANRAQREMSQNEVAAARESLRQAESVERAARAGLVQKRLSEEDVRSAAATVEQLKGDVAYYDELVRQARIISPVSGTVTQKLVNQGEFVGLGGKLLNIVSPESLFLEGIASERQLPFLRPGQAAQVTVDARPGRVYAGTVREILPLAEGLSRSTRVRIALRLPDQRVDELPVGAFARATLPVARRSGVLTIPNEAVLSEAGVDYVFRIVEGRAKRTNIELGIRDGGRVQITSGLRAGDQIVTAGSPAVVDGARVSVK